MKKKILMCVCAICFIVPCMFVLSACGNSEMVKVTLNINLPSVLNSLSESANDILNKNELSVEKGSVLDLEDFSENVILANYFDGWYSGVGANAEKITNITEISRDIELYARWNIEELEGTPGLKYYYNEGYDRTFVTGYEGTETTIKIPECVIINNEIHKVNAVGFSNGNNTIEHIEIGENIQIISDSAFKNFTKLKSIVIPKNVYSIGTAIFEGCSILTDVRVDINNRYYDSREKGVIVETLTNTLIASISNFIPDTVRVIGKKAFYNFENVGNGYVFIPEGVVKIEDDAFCGSSILGVKLPKTLKELGMRCFKNCIKLEIVDFQENDNITSLNQYTFANCNKLQYINGQLRNLAYIGIDTFAGCSNLEYCFIREDLKVNHNLYLGENVMFHSEIFADCNKLKIVINDNDLLMDGNFTDYDFIDVIYSVDDYSQDDDFYDKFELAAESELEGYYKWVRKQ